MMSVFRHGYLNDIKNMTLAYHIDIQLICLCYLGRVQSGIQA
jgi:hypothetical protein